MPRIDLHTHTTASDGVLSPSSLVALAADCDVRVLGITDHDTVAGVAEAVAASEAAGIGVVAGIEISSRYEDRNVHVLGLFLDSDARPLRESLDTFRDERTERARRMVERLNDLGYALTFDEVLAHARGDVIARPHVARALKDRGHVPNVRDAFTAGLIGDGGLAYVGRPPYSPFDAVALVRAAGGAAVLAHPGVLHHGGEPAGLPYELVERLAGEGLAGIEVDHPEHPPALRDRLRVVAGELDLVGTGGSDCHGHEGRPPGTCTTSEESLEALRARATAGG
jgi:predicted metal-dependent phosphoesterase TrpH